jgi:hypothetical protein
MSSSSGMFARKGDPWVTRKEGERDFNRQVEVENPDMDADRQRHARIKGFSKEFQDRVKRPVDVKMTMREAVETEQSTRLDGYQAEKAFRRKPAKGEWPKAGRDFEVATVQRRLVGVAIRTRKAMNALEGKNNTVIVSEGKVSSLDARVNAEGRIACPRGCGYVSHDSRNISKHLRVFVNGCCTHQHCNCNDCRRARNE